MKDNFEVFRILPGSVPLRVQTSGDLGAAITAAFLWAVETPGHYTVCECRTSELIFEVTDFKAREREEKARGCNA